MLKTTSTTGWLLATLLLLTAAKTHAQSDDPAARAAARDLGYEGVQAYQAGNYSNALDRLSRAYQVMKVPSLGLWLGRTHVQQGKLVEASELFLEVTRLTVSGGDQAVQQKAQKDAAAEREALAPRLAKLVVVVSGPLSKDAKVTLDGREFSSALLGIGSPANPGKHVAIAQGSDGTKVAGEITLTEGKSGTLTLELKAATVAPTAATTVTPVPEPVAAAPASAPVPLTPKAEQAPVAATHSTEAASKRPIPNWIGYTALGLGAVGIGYGTYAGLMAKSNKSKEPLLSQCGANGCSPSVSNEVDTVNSLRLRSIVGIYGGAAFAAAGAVILWILPDSKSQEKPVALSVVTTRDHQELNMTLAF